jgi:LPXTG-motif cell wall-anchored protein
MDEGLSFKDEDGQYYNPIKAYVVNSVNGVDVQTSINSSQYSVKTTGLSDETCTFEVVFTDLKKIADVKAGSKVYFEYAVQLTDVAVIENKNTVQVEYPNNSNDSTQTGKTPEITDIVFTYKVKLNKVDENGSPLTGAEFTLSRKNQAGNYVPVESQVVTNDSGDTFTWSQLADGYYMLEETTVPAGYNKMETKYFKITAVHDQEVDTTTGNHKLTELKVTMLDVNGNEISDDLSFEAELSTGTLTTNVENLKGVVLPSTGGAGVKALYTMGSILVLGAAVLLITRRRMSIMK